MDIEKSNKTKTCLVIIVFIMIILLSAYVVVDKILTRNKSYGSEELIYTESLLENSKEITELSLDNKIISNLYESVNNETIDYMLFQNKGTKLSWDTKSVIIMHNLDKYKNNSFDIVNIDKDIFEQKYLEIFGNNLNKEIRTSSNCPTTTYNLEEGIYSINLSCYEVENNTYYKTFLKNITLDDNSLIINKYYVFITEYENTLVKDYSLYKTNNFVEENMIVGNISYEDINSYISNMNTISYVYKKDFNGVYYLNAVK